MDQEQQAPDSASGGTGVFPPRSSSSSSSSSRVAPQGGSAAQEQDQDPGAAACRADAQCTAAAVLPWLAVQSPAADATTTALPDRQQQQQGQHTPAPVSPGTPLASGKQAAKPAPPLPPAALQGAGARDTPASDSSAASTDVQPTADDAGPCAAGATGSAASQAEGLVAASDEQQQTDSSSSSRDEGSSAHAQPADSRAAGSAEDLEPLAQASGQGQQLRDAGGSSSKTLPAPSAGPDPWEAACLAMGAAMDAAAGSVRPSSEAQGPAAAVAGGGGSSSNDDEGRAGSDDDDDDSVLLALLGVC